MNSSMKITGIICVRMFGVLLIMCLSLSVGPSQAQEWTIVSPPIGHIEHISFLDKNNGWLTGGGPGGNVILHTPNGGSDWEDRSPQADAAYVDVFFVDENTGYTVGQEFTAQTIILKTGDGGQSWQQQASPVSNSYLGDVFFINATHGWAVGKNTSTNKIVIFRTIDGNTWTSCNHPDYEGALYSVHFPDVSHGWAVGQHASGDKPAIILYTDDGGQNWVAQTHPLTDHHLLADVSFVNADTGYVVGRTSFWTDDTGVGLKTTDGGTTWELLTVPEV